MDLIWKRPESTEFPKVWRKFQARDINRDKLVEYRIQDLPELRFQDGIHFMVKHFLTEEPISEALDIFNDANSIDDFKLLWKLSFEQKMAIACFKNGTDEIVGVNANYVECKEDYFIETFYKQAKSEKIRQYGELMFLLRKNCNVCELYDVDVYLGSLGLTVDREYRRRGIAEQFLRSRQAICNEFNIKLTSTAFSSGSSNRIADKVGVKPDKIIRFNDLRKTHPQINLPDIKSDAMSIKSMVF